MADASSVLPPTTAPTARSLRFVAALVLFLAWIVALIALVILSSKPPRDLSAPAQPQSANPTPSAPIPEGSGVSVP